LNAYIHVPFCTSFCSYCDFTSFAGNENRIPEYVSALCAEIESSDLHGPLQTIYFGGGTPSLLNPSQISSVLEALRCKADFASDVEISTESNPDSVDLEKLEGYRRVGINRLSLGAQAAQDELLITLGRRHDVEKVFKAVRSARSAGFKNINLDIMLGLPGGNMGMLQETLERYLPLNPEHVSLYALQVEVGTPLAEKVKRGLVVPDEDEQADQYAWAQGCLSSCGWRQYEVSNFSKPSMECRHNLSVWRGEDYQGFGVSAVGTKGLQRRTNTGDLNDYLSQACAGCFQPEIENLSKETRQYEKVMLGLRTREGVSRGLILSVGGDSQTLESLIRDGWLLEKGDLVAAAPKTYFVLHGVLLRLLN
jgi:oxygen-independent coproporphyrinogen-3 oxidase